MKQTLKLLLSLAVALTAFGSAFAQKQTNPYEAREKGYYVGIMESKSGLIATSVRADEIYIIKDGSAKMLVNTRNCGMYMQMSKDGKLVGFKSISDDYTKQAPAVVDVTTGKVTLLEPYSRECGQVSFSDDGTMAYMLGNSLVIRKGNDKRTFDMGVYVNIVNLSPDGKKAAFTTIEGESFIVDTATGVKSRVDIQGNATYNPIWAPDGKKIAYQRIDGTLSVMNLETKALYNIGEASSPVWTPDSKEIIFVRAQRENDIFVPSASVIKTSFDGTKANVIVARSASVPVAVATTLDGGLAVSYAVGEQRGIYKISAERNGRLRSASTATSVLAAKESGKIGSEYKVNHNIVKDIPKKTEAHPLMEGTIGYLDIPYINQVWDTPSDHAGCYDYGYVCCAPSSSCMLLGYYQMLEPHAVQSRKVNATAYYSWYVGRDYTAPLTSYTFNERCVVNRGWYGCTSSSVGGGYGFMWYGSKSPSNSMHNFYKNNGMKNSYFQSSWSTFVNECKANRPYTVCLQNSTDGHVVLGFRTNCYVESGGSNFVNATGCFVCHDPYGDYNNGYPNWDGRYSSYDWPGYNTGHKNINTFYWGCVAIPPDNLNPIQAEITYTPSTVEFNCKAGEHPTVTVNVTGLYLDGVIFVASATPGRFPVSVTQLPPDGGSFTVTFENSDLVGTYGPGGTAVDYDFYIRLLSGSISLKVPVRATVTENVQTPQLSASASSLSFSCSPLGCGPGESPTESVTISGTNLEGDISLAIAGENANLFHVSPTTIPKSAGSGTVTVTYSPNALGNHSATLTASSPNATPINIALTGRSVQTEFDDNIELSEKWNYSQNGSAPSWIFLNSTSSNVVRSLAHLNDNLYVLQEKSYAAPEIVVIDAYSGAKKGTLDVTGVKSAAYQISSITAFDGKLIGAAGVSASNTLYAYAWDNDNSAPRVMLEAAADNHGNEAMGAQVAVSGTMSNGKLWFTNSNATKVYVYTVSNGNANATPQVISLKKADGSTEFAGGGTYGQAGVTPNADGTFWVTGKDEPPTLFNASGVAQRSMANSVLGNSVTGTAFHQFTFGEKQYALATAYKDAGKATNGGFYLVNVTNGVAEATEPIGFYPSNGLGSATNTQFMTNVEYALRNSNHTIDVWVCVNNQGLAYYVYDGDKEGGVESVRADSFRVIYAGNIIRVLGDEARSISVYSMQGTKVAEARNTDNLSTALLCNGVYVVRITDANGSVKAIKIVKK